MPFAYLESKKALKDVPAGGTLEVLTTDPGSPSDFEAFCRATGNILVESTEQEGTFRFLVRRIAEV